MVLERISNNKDRVTDKKGQNSLTRFLEGIRSDPLGSIIIDRLSNMDRNTFPLKVSDEEFVQYAAIQNLFAYATTARILQPIKNYYSKKDLKNFRKSLPLKRRAKILGEKMVQCKTGPDHWKEYQDICRF